MAAVNKDRAVLNWGTYYGNPRVTRRQRDAEDYVTRLGVTSIIGVVVEDATPDTLVALLEVPCRRFVISSSSG